MSNVFDQALETAMERTSAWVKDQESMGMVVTEQMAANNHFARVSYPSKEEVIPYNNFPCTRAVRGIVYPS